MDFFARLIDSWLWFVYFPAHPKKQDKIQSLLRSTLRLSMHFECLEVLSWEKTGKISGQTGKRCIQFTWNLNQTKLAPNCTLRRGRINWMFASHKTPKCTGLYLSVDSQDGLSYLGRIIARCSMRIVSRTLGVVVCTLTLHAEGPWFKSWQVVHMDLE